MSRGLMHVFLFLKSSQQNDWSIFWNIVLVIFITARFRQHWALARCSDLLVQLEGLCKHSFPWPPCSVHNTGSQLFHAGRNGLVYYCPNNWSVNVNKGLFFCLLNESNSHSNICHWAEATDCRQTNKNQVQPLKISASDESSQSAFSPRDHWASRCAAALLPWILFPSKTHVWLSRR